MAVVFQGFCGLSSFDTLTNTHFQLRALNSRPVTNGRSLFVRSRVLNTRARCKFKTINAVTIKSLISSSFSFPFPAFMANADSSMSSTLSESSSLTTMSIRNSRGVLPQSIKFQKISAKGKPFSRTSCLSVRNEGLERERYSIGDKDGVVIVDHGSRRKESNMMLNEFVEMFRDKTGYSIVEPAHMELAEPSIKDAFNLCVERGANRVIISPFFLFPGRHWYQDIPSLAAEAAKEHPGISYLVTAPLGLHELLVDVMKDRISHCLAHVAGEAEECSVCVGTDRCHLH